MLYAPACRAASAAGCGPFPTAQRHQMQRLQQRVRVLTERLHRCAAAHSKLQHRFAALEEAAELRCARLQQQVQVGHNARVVQPTVLGQVLLHIT